MHDPLVVAHTIIRPWPARSGFPTTGSRGDGVRWQIRLKHACTADCGPGCPGPGVFPWWRTRSYMRFWRLAGRDYYWPPLVTIWHAEPGGADALTICRDRYQDQDGTWKLTRSWRWHVHHWKIQLHPAQTLRRRLLTRCAWCGGRDRAGDPVNTGFAWDPPKTVWWRGEPGLYHRDCSSVASARRQCACTEPAPAHETWGRCLRCDKPVPHGRTPEQLAYVQQVATLPDGARPGR